MGRPNMTESIAAYIRHREPQIDRATSLAAATHAVAEIIEILSRHGEKDAADFLKNERWK